jgi:hypothetical protein
VRVGWATVDRSITRAAQWAEDTAPVDRSGILKMEALSSSETLVFTSATRRNIPENGILHSHRQENLKSYIALTDWTL